MYKIKHSSFDRDMEYPEPVEFGSVISSFICFLLIATDQEKDWRNRTAITKTTIINFLNELADKYGLTITKE